MKIEFFWSDFAVQIFEIVNLANELLPPLPQGTISLPSSTNFVKGPHLKKYPGGSSGKQEDLNGNVAEVSPREKLLNEQSELLQQFGMDLLPVLIQVSYPENLCIIPLFDSPPPFSNVRAIFWLADIWIQCEWSCSTQMSLSHWETDVLQPCRYDPVSTECDKYI